MIKTIITNIKELRKPCLVVTKDDKIENIIQDLKDTLIAHPEGIGLTANQIGYNKKISLLRLPKNIDQSTKKIDYEEMIIINAKITEKIGKPCLIKNEGCLSFPGVHVPTDRYLFVGIEFLDENLQEKAGLMQDIQAFAAQHEIDHQNGLTIFDRKHRSKQ